jgi:hypothetical protein
MGWLAGWRYRKSHTILPASGAGTNYQIKIVVHYGSGTDSGQDVYLNGKCKTDFGDIRFTRADGVTLLDYWMESCSVGDNAVFWVEVADDLSTTAQIIYIYYGNPTAITTSNGSATFVDFDDFLSDTLSNYVQIDVGWIIDTTPPGYLKTGSSIGAGFISKSMSLTRNYAIRAKWYMATLDSGFGFIWGTAGGSEGSLNGYIANYYVTSTYSTLRQYVSGSRTDLVGLPTPPSGWYIGELRITPSNMVVIRDTTQDASSTDTYFTSLSGVGFRQKATNVYFLDWWALRKYVSPEPSHGSWGLEESIPLGFIYRAEWIDFAGLK